jgi:hypothetical protein
MDNEDNNINMNAGGNIGANELVYNVDDNLGIYSGGFSVNSMLMKAGISPIVTYNTPKNQSGGGSDELKKVSDLFESLVVPNWALHFGRGINSYDFNNSLGIDSDSDSSSDFSSDSDNDSKTTSNVIEDSLYNKLLSMVEMEKEVKKKKKTRRLITKNGKKTKKHK